MRVVVVGAGPAGASLSLLLARAGVEVVLLERERDFARVFRGEGLMPSGLDALHQMGFGAALAALPGDPFEAWDVFLDGIPVMHVEEPHQELGARAPRVVSQPALLERIVGEAERQSAFSFRPGVSARGLLESGGRVRGVRTSTREGEAQLEADLVIGADGRGSMVRKRAGLELALLPESYDVVWFKTPAPAELEGRSPVRIYASGPDVVLSYVSWDGRWQLAQMLPKGSWGEVRERDWLAECAALMPEATAAHLLAQRDAIEGPSLLDVIVGRCPRWHAPGVLLIGDAAHPMSPVRAQGINMALRDAIVAANHLVPASQRGDPDGCLAAIQAEREREIVPAQKLQLREVRGQRWARERPWLMRPMLKLAPLLGRMRWMERAWLRQQHPLRFGITEVRLCAACG